MVAIVGMRMIMHTAGAVIDQVGCYDEQYGGKQQPGFVVYEKLLKHQEAESREK